MKTPEEIKNALECCTSSPLCHECPYFAETDCNALEQDALAYIQQLEAAQPKWISVEERGRLPKCDQGVLCVIQTGWGPAVTEGYFWKNDQCISPIDEDYAFDDVTHWMPMPKPPKEDE